MNQCFCYFSAIFVPDGLGNIVPVLSGIPSIGIPSLSHSIFVNGEYVSPLHPEHHSVSDGHDKAYNIPFHPVKRRKNCRRGQKLHSPVSAEIQVSDVSSRKQDPTGWHWRLLLVILHNNRESSYRWRNKKCILYLYSSAERNEVLRSHGSDSCFAAIGINPLTLPFIFRFGNQDSVRRKSPRIFIEAM